MAFLIVTLLTPYWLANSNSLGRRASGPIAPEAMSVRMSSATCLHSNSGLRWSIRSRLSSRDTSKTLDTPEQVKYATYVSGCIRRLMSSYTPAMTIPSAHHVPDSTALAVAWQKSHHSNPSGECAELGLLTDGRIALRNSRDPRGPALLLSRDALEDLLDSARCGEAWLWDLLDDYAVWSDGAGIIIRGEGAAESGPAA